MRKKIVAGNWKMNKTLQEGIELAKEVNSKVKAANAKDVKVIIGTPFIHLAEVSKLVDPAVVAVSAQNCATEVSGAYTGEVSAAMVASTGSQYVILGHSERRSYYGETDEILVKKVQRALENNLDVIFCVGEVLAERSRQTFRSSEISIGKRFIQPLSRSVHTHRRSLRTGVGYRYRQNSHLCTSRGNACLYPQNYSRQIW